VGRKWEEEIGKGVSKRESEEQTRVGELAQSIGFLLF
jgi:hypothetical protein